MNIQLKHAVIFSILCSISSFSALAGQAQTGSETSATEPETSMTSRGSRVNSSTTNQSPENTESVYDQPVAYAPAPVNQIDLMGSRGDRYRSSFYEGNEGENNKMMGNGQARGSR